MVIGMWMGFLLPCAHGFTCVTIVRKKMVIGKWYGLLCVPSYRVCAVHVCWV